MTSSLHFCCKASSNHHASPTMLDTYQELSTCLPIFNLVLVLRTSCELQSSFVGQWSVLLAAPFNPSFRLIAPTTFLCEACRLWHLRLFFFLDSPKHFSLTLRWIWDLEAVCRHRSSFVCKWIFICRVKLQNCRYYLCPLCKINVHRQLFPLAWLSRTHSVLWTQSYLFSIFYDTK